MNTIDLLIWVVLASLANYKVSRMITSAEETGPFDLFAKFRAFVGEATWVGKGFHCIVCTSFWGALVCALLIGAGLPVNLFLLVWGAIAALTFGLWRYFG